MGKKNKSGSAAVDLTTILNAVNSSEKKAGERHNDITSRLDKIEKQYDNLSEDVKECKKDHNVMKREIDYLQSAVNTLQQEKLNANLIIRGIPDIEKKPGDVLDMVFFLLSKVPRPIRSSDVILATRVGNNSDGNVQRRPILVKFVSEQLKSDVMTELKKQRLNCSQLTYYDKAWGSETDIIYVGDNLTKMTSTLFYEARKLKKKNLAKYVWTKNGNIFVKKCDGDVAYRISNMQQLSAVRIKLGKETILSSTKNDDKLTESEESDQSNSQDEDETNESVVMAKDGKKRRPVRSPEDSSRLTRQRQKILK